MGEIIMKMEVSELIDAPRAEVWRVITDIDDSASIISGIEKVEVLERPENGLVGLKWRETRTMFGQTATEVMWITNAEEQVSYETRAENRGAIYQSGFKLSDEAGKTRLTMFFEGVPTSFFGRLMSAITSPFFKGATEKAIKQDLIDIKAKAEGE
jgi:carbon monoxide dehydrogenase subunit G